MANTNYSSINLIQSINDWNNTHTLNDKEMRRIIAASNNLHDGYTTNRFIQISKDSKSSLSIPTPSAPNLSGLKMHQIKDELNLLNIDLDDISEDIRTNIKDPTVLRANTHLNADGEDELLKYALDNTPYILEILINHIDHDFEIVTDKKTFTINISKNNIPHLLGFLSKSYAKNQSFNTRFYDEIRKEFNSGNLNYLDNIKNIIRTYKKQILSSIKNIEDPIYQKELWNKIASKTCNLKTLADLIKLNDLNEIEVWVDKNKDSITNDKDTYLLLMPIPNEDNYTSLVIEKEKNEESFYVKSDCLITKDAYNNLENTKLEGVFFKKTNILEKNLLFANKNNSNPCLNAYDKLKKQRSEENNLLSNIEAIKSFSGEQSNLNLSISTVINNIREKLKESKTSIENEIKKLLRSSNNNDIKDNLPTLLIRHYQETTETSNLNKFYSLLAEVFCNDKEILHSIRNCFINNKEILRKCMYNNKKNEKSISLIKTAHDLYIKVNIIINEEVFCDYHGSIKTFGKQFEEIKEKLNNLYNKITEFKIETDDNAMEYLYLLNSYYELYPFINISMLDISKTNYEINNNTLYILKNNYRDIYNRLIQIGYLTETDIKDMPVINSRTFDDIKDFYKQENNIEINENVENAINILKKSKNSDIMLEALKNLNQQEISYVLFITELSTLQTIVTSFKDYESYKPFINQYINRFNQINNIRKNSLKKNYIKILQKIAV